jgi:hypothetical protein
MDYGKWLQRAEKYLHGMRCLPGNVQVTTAIEKPLSETEYGNHAAASRLPIPESLRRFWTEVSGHCQCKYWWDTPAQFHKQLAVALPNWSQSHIWGGPDFDSAYESIDLASGTFPFIADDSRRDGYPRDVRFFGSSLPFMSVGNGDSIGVYVRDELENPPVVYLCSICSGANRIIAPGFDEFLESWETLGYIGAAFLGDFTDPKTGLIKPERSPVALEALTALLRGETRPDLVRPPLLITERDWLSETDPWIMLDWLDKTGHLDEQKLRLFGCACCRRVWEQLGKWSRNAVEVSERFATGHASRSELDAARSAVLHGDRATQRSRDPGVFRSAAAWAVSATTAFLVSSEILKHFDEPQLSIEKAAHAELVRQIFGNSFQDRD